MSSLSCPQTLCKGKSINFKNPRKQAAKQSKWTRTTNANEQITRIPKYKISAQKKERVTQPKKPKEKTHQTQSQDNTPNIRETSFTKT